MHNKPIKILDLRDSPWVDGPGRTILQTAKMIDHDRCKISIAAFCQKSLDDHAYIKQAEKYNLEVIPIYEQGPFDHKVIQQVLKAIKQNSIDIIHSHDFRSDLVAFICSKLSGVPAISTCHGWIANNLKGRIYTRIDKFLLKYFDRIVTVSSTMQKQLLNMGYLNEKIEVVPNALIIDDYQPNKANQSFRNELGIDKEARLIANIGRLSPEKGQDIFLKAARELLNEKENLYFLVIGRGPEQQNLEDLAKNLGIRDHVIFTGHRDDVVNIYNSIDLVVQSSYTEGMPNVILESLLMEVPVVATSVGGTAEVAQNNYSALLIEPHNLDNLVGGLREFLNNESRLIEMSRNGRKFVCQNFNHLDRVRKMADIYTTLHEHGCKK